LSVLEFDSFEELPGPDSNQTDFISEKSAVNNSRDVLSDCKAKIPEKLPSDSTVAAPKNKKKDDSTSDSTVSDVTQDVRPSDTGSEASPETATTKPHRHRNKYRPGDLKVEIVYVPTEDYEERKKRVIDIMAECILRDLDREAMKKLKEQEAAENAVVVPQNGDEKKKAPVTNQAKPVSKTKKVPTASNVNVDNDFIQETIDFWEKKTGKKFTREDARQMIENVSGYFNTLHRWDIREKEKKKPT